MKRLINIIGIWGVLFSGLYAVDYQNSFTCGIFDTALTSYQTIKTEQNDVFNTCTISVKDYNLTEDENHNITCYVNSSTNELCQCTGTHCSVNHTCTIVPEPKNKLTYTVYDTTATGSYTVDKTWNSAKDAEAGTVSDTDHGVSDINITFHNLNYGDFNFTKDVSYINFLPEHTYDNNNTKVMLLGNVDFDGNGQLVTFDGGDYYFKSFKIDKDTNGSINQISICAKKDIRIFVKNDFVYSGNHINDAECGGKIFIYVAGNSIIDANGGGSSTLPIFLYSKGDVTIENSGNSNDWVGAITSEGTINITGENINFIYDNTAGDFGYGKCQMCYAISNNGNLISLFDALNISLNFPRDMAIVNSSGEPLNDVNVTQQETSDALGSVISPAEYKVVDKNGTLVPNKHIQTTTTYTVNTLFGGTESLSFSNSGDNSVVDRYVPGVDTPLNSVEIDTTASYGNYPNNGTNDYYMFETYEGSGSFLGTTGLNYYATYYDQKGRFYNVQLDYCDINQSVLKNAVVTGFVDAWDTFRNSSDRHISTKIAGKDFNLSVAFLPDGNVTQENTGISVMFCVVKDNGDGTYTPISEFKTFDIDDSQKNYEFSYHNSSTDIVRMNTEEAVKKAALEFEVCANYDGNKFYLYDYDKCKLSNGTINYCSSNYETNRLCMRKFRSSDEFAIRPYAFRVFGNNQYKKAGEEFNLTIKAVDENNYTLNTGNVHNVIGVKGYDEPVSNLEFTSQFYVPTSSELSQMQTDTGETNVTYCPDPGSFYILNPGDFKDGDVNTTLEYSETGILTLKVSEKVGNEFAKVDEDDTNDSVRLIKPATIITDESNLTARDVLLFIPYEFNTSVEYNTTSGAGWVYMANDVNNSTHLTYSVPKMAAYLKYKITALNKQGKITKNYTKTCFPDTSEEHCPRVNGLKLNSTFDLFLDMDMNTTKNTVISLFTYDSNTSNAAVYTPAKTVSLVSGTINNIKEAVYPNDFLNGSSEVKVYFNINKDYRHYSKEINITVLDANTSTSWMNNPGATDIFNGSEIKKPVQFRYGRIKIGNVAGYNSDLSSEVEYQYWTDKGWTVNTQHTSKIFGSIYTDKSIISPGGFVKMTEGNITKGVSYIDFDTNHTLPYSVKVHISIPEWLWYHPLAKPYKDPSSTNNDCLTHPCVKVDFLRSGKGWGGVSSNTSVKYSEKTRTADINASSNELNATKSQVRKINW